MNTDQLKDILSEVEKLSQDVGEFIRHELDKVTKDQIIIKDHDTSLVSYVDQNAEKMIVKKLSELLPDAGFITEEGTVKQEEKEFIWIIDPLDGTNNFLHRIPHFAVSIALRQNTDIILGVVLDVMRNECYSAIKDGGSHLNGQPISVSKVGKLSESMLATGFPYSLDYDYKSLVDTLGHWFHHARGVRRFGAAALDLCFAASGKVDCYYEGFLNIWDIAAGIIIVEEAGGKVTDYFGGDKYKSGSEIVASNGHIHDVVLQVLSKHFTESNT